MPVVQQEKIPCNGGKGEMGGNLCKEKPVSREGLCSSVVVTTVLTNVTALFVALCLHKKNLNHWKIRAIIK